MPKQTPHKQYFDYPPIAKQRAYVGSRGAHTPKRTLDFETKVKQDWNGPTFEGPVYMIVNLETKGFTVEIGPAPMDKRPLRGDVDNYLKAICDGLNQKGYKDDRQVVFIVGALNVQSELIAQLSEGLRGV